MLDMKRDRCLSPGFRRNYHYIFDEYADIFASTYMLLHSAYIQKAK